MSQATLSGAAPALMLLVRRRHQQPEADHDPSPSGGVSPALSGSVAVVDGIDHDDTSQRQVLPRSRTDGFVGRNAGGPAWFQSSAKHPVLQAVHRQVDCADVSGQGDSGPADAISADGSVALTSSPGVLSPWQHRPCAAGQKSPALWSCTADSPFRLRRWWAARSNVRRWPASWRIPGW